MAAAMAHNVRQNNAIPLAAIHSQIALAASGIELPSSIPRAPLFWLLYACWRFTNARKVPAATIPFAELQSRS